MGGRKYKKITKTYYVSDFETTGKKQYELEGRTRVFLHYTENIYDDDDNFLGMTIEEYYQFITKKKFDNERRIVFFHNLRFDILFLEYYLYEIGYIFSEENKEKTYHAIRDDKYNVYQFTIRVSNDFHVIFKDSLKLLQSSVDKLPNLRGIEKLGDFDYEKLRYEKTLDDFDEKELQYVKHDVWKVKDVLKESLEHFGDYLTIASSSYNDWLKRFNKDNKYNYRNHFPTLTEEEEVILRKSYNGGLVILNPKYKGKIIDKEVITFDVNSLYPSRMRYEKLPFGKPIYINSPENLSILKRRGFDLFCYAVSVNHMKIKEGYHPFITTSKSYLLNRKTDDFPRELENMVFYWTNIDLENVVKYYDIDYEILYEFSFAFRSRYGIFDDYIDYFMNMKENAKNQFEYIIAKLRLNSLYGKFGTRQDRLSYVSYFDKDDGLIKYNIVENRLKNQYYLPLAIFITAYARNVLINALQEEREAFIYADTDSLHLFKDKYKGTLNVDDKKLGYWAFESISTKSLFLANKQYIKVINGKLEHTIASLNKENHHLINFENFKKGTTIKKGKKMLKAVKGGNILVDTDFTFS